MFFRNNTSTPLLVRKQTVVVWSPGGKNTTAISLALAQRISAYTRTILVELPCLGIPRLAIEAGIMDRTNNADAAILEFERKGGSPLRFCTRCGDNLIILPANPYALPDHPVVHKVSDSRTLPEFPGFLINEAEKSGHQVVIFDCQGVLASPMTFYSLKLADKIILVVDKPSDIAWSLLNKKRLVEGYEINEKSFVVSADDKTYFEEIEKVLQCPVVSLDSLINILDYKQESKNYLPQQKEVVTN